MLFAAAIGLSWAAGRAVDYEALPTPALQPRPEAFAVAWTTIYALLGVRALAADEDEEPPLVVAALLLTVLWAAAARARRLRLAAGVLVVAAALAWRGIDDAATALLAGWLSVASVLSLAIVAPAVFDAPCWLGVAAGLALVASPRPWATLAPVALAAALRR
jgi:tryptophan-rich sensory protein